MTSPPFGLLAARRARLPSSRSRTPDGKIRDLPSKGAFKVPGGSIVDMITPGSGGFGDPAERDPAAIARDLEEGYVTPEGVARDYKSR